MIGLLPWLPVIAAALVVAATAWLLYARHRLARQGSRERRVLDELDELGVEDVTLRLEGERAKQDRDLGAAQVAHGKRGIARRGTGFLVAPAGTSRWSIGSGDRVLLRFERGGARYEVRCRIAGRERLTALWRRRLGIKARDIYRLVPAGVLVKRERRDMMRFYLGGDKSSPTGTTDARRFVDLQVWLAATDLDTTGQRRLPPRLPTDAFHVLGPGPEPDEQSPPQPDPAPSPGCPVDVVDFSGTGLRVEAGLPAMARLMLLGPDGTAEDVLHRLGEQALLVTVALRFRFPATVQDLEPSVPQRIWLLAEAARLSLLESESGDEESRVRLGLAFLYQGQGMDAAGLGPERWEMIRGQGNAGDFVVIHNALNQAAARLQSDSVGPRGA